VKVKALDKYMSDHPDQNFASYISQGLSNGFRIGFRYGESTLKQSKVNMAIDNPQVVSDYIAEELAANRLIELTPEEADNFGIHCSPISIIPKKNKPGQWRLIVDLSSPKMRVSTTASRRSYICSLSYTSVDAVAEKILALGKGTLIAKMDIKQAYRMVPVNPADRWLLGMRWDGKVLVDKALPFGLRSAPYFFSNS
jgi:hypothetical protein